MACVPDEQADAMVKVGPFSPRSIEIALQAAFDISRGIDSGCARVAFWP